MAAKHASSGDGLLNRLRLFARSGVSDVTDGEYKDACSQAADEIERLRTSMAALIKDALV